MRIRINISAWGRHVGAMRTTLLPSLIANLPHLAAHHHVTIDLCSTPHTLQELAACPAFLSLADFADIELIEIEPAGVRPHNMLSRCHAHSLEQECDGCLFIQPDMVFAAGSFRWLADAIHGANAVLVCTPRVIINNIPAGLLASPRQLMRIMLDNKHPVTNSLIVNGNQASSHPSHLYWQIGTDGIVARCFHMHPLFIVPRGSKIGNTIDGDYLQTYYPNAERFVYATNSDDFAAIELSPPHHMGLTVYHSPASREGIKKWMRRYTLPIHHLHAKQSIRLIADFTDEAKWEEAERAAVEFYAGLIS